MADISAGTSHGFHGLRGGRVQGLFPRTARSFSLGNLTQDLQDIPHFWRAAQQDARSQAAIQPPVQRQITTDSPTYGINPQRNPGEFIAALIEESKSAPPEQPAFSMPDPFRRPRSPQAMQSNAARKYYFDNMLAAYPIQADGSAHPMWAMLPPQMQVDLDAYAKDRDGYRSSLSGSQESTGYMGPGSGLGTVMTWGQSIPNMLYSAGDMVYAAGTGSQDQDGYDNFRHALNTFSAPGQQAAAMLGYASPVGAGHSAWSDGENVRQTYEAMDDGSPQPYEPDAYGPTVEGGLHNMQLTQEINAGSRGGGEDYFQRRGFSPGWARLAGTLSDDLFNPFLDAPGIAAASQSRRLWPVLRAAGMEFGPGAGLVGLEAGADLLQRLEEERAKARQAYEMRAR